jgi:hypothetical protein
MSGTMQDGFERAPSDQRSKAVIDPNARPHEAFGQLSLPLAPMLGCFWVAPG